MLNGKYHAARRRFLRIVSGLGAAGLFTIKSSAAEDTTEPFAVLDKNNCIDIGGRGAEILKTAHSLGLELEKKHGGCARCTVATLQRSIDFIPEDRGLLRAASCLDGGATPTKEANCGAFTGSGIVIGWICGTDTFGDTSLSHDLLHELHERFESEYGSVLCSDVRTKVEKKCPELVARVSRWTADIILRQFTNYS